MPSGTGIANRCILDTPLAIVDLETTGLLAGGDKIVEVSAVRIEPGKAPTLYLNTLINPHRPVSATEIHGITDADVADAPDFKGVLGSLGVGFEDAVFAAYNVYFDVRFLQSEFSAAGIFKFPPYFCLMYLRPMLDLGPKCTLEDACKERSIDLSIAHRASLDALACAQLWQFYATVLAKRGIKTYGDLARLKKYKFTDTFIADVLPQGTFSGFPETSRLKPRMETPVVRAPSRTGNDHSPNIAEYWDALATALSDLDISANEILYLNKKKSQLNLLPEEVRWLHARAFSSLLTAMCQDKAITSSESETLYRIACAFRSLGWAPGDSIKTVAENSTLKSSDNVSVRRQSIWSRFFG